MMLIEETPAFSEKLFLVPLYPPQIPHGVVWDRTRSTRNLITIQPLHLSEMTVQKHERLRSDPVET
jgi:hypothetical protein